MYRCENWTLRSLSAEELIFSNFVLEKTVEVPLGCQEIKPASSKGNKPWIFFEGLMLKLKLQYFGHLM